MTVYKFYRTCVGWPQLDVHAHGGLCDMIDTEIDITRATFLKHVDREELKQIEENLGYAAHPKQGLTMSADWALRYHRSKLHGKRVYYFKYSGIEYVFTGRTTERDKS